MFLTENVNYNDSILFLLSARMALKESIELSDVEEKDQLKDFIVNEATDYEVMSLLVDGKFPEKKHDYISEIILFSKFKDQLVEDAEGLSESIDPEIINDILFGVNSLCSEGNSADDLVQELPPKRKSQNLMSELKYAIAEDKNMWNDMKNKKINHLSELLITALVGFAGYKAYNRFFSKAANACSNLGGIEKTKCMNKYKIQGLDAQVRELQKGIGECRKAKNPEKCKESLTNKIIKLREKIAKLRRG